HDDFGELRGRVSEPGEVHQRARPVAAVPDHREPAGLAAAGRAERQREFQAVRFYQGRYGRAAMTLGAERKKVAFLGAVVVFGGVAVYINNLPETPAPTPSKAASKQTPAAMAAQKSGAQPPNIRRAKQKAGGAADAFKPSLKPPEEQTNYAAIDP